jgi:hypothetical protein
MGRGFPLLPPQVLGGRIIHWQRKVETVENILVVLISREIEN